MMQHHNYSLTELENMIPWEREIYIGLLMKYLEEEKERIEEEQLRSRYMADDKVKVKETPKVYEL